LGLLLGPAQEPDGEIRWPRRCPDSVGATVAKHSMTTWTRRDLLRQFRSRWADRIRRRLRSRHSPECLPLRIVRPRPTGSRYGSVCSGKVDLVRASASGLVHRRPGSGDAQPGQHIRQCRQSWTCPGATAMTSGNPQTWTRRGLGRQPAPGASDRMIARSVPTALQCLVIRLGLAWRSATALRRSGRPTCARPSRDGPAVSSCITRIPYRWLWFGSAPRRTHYGAGTCHRAVPVTADTPISWLPTTT
jgi:hypothetical protein